MRRGAIDERVEPIRRAGAAVGHEVADAAAPGEEVVLDDAGAGLSIDDRPVVVEFRTDASEKVFPMVPAGASNDDLVLAPGQDKRGLR